MDDSWSQGVWARALKDRREASLGTIIVLAEAIWGVAVAKLMWDLSQTDDLTFPVFASFTVVAILAGWLSVNGLFVALSLVRASYRQRNEARDDLRKLLGDEDAPLNIEIGSSGYSIGRTAADASGREGWACTLIDLTFINREKRRVILRLSLRMEVGDRTIAIGASGTCRQDTVGTAHLTDIGPLSHLLTDIELDEDGSTRGHTEFVVSGLQLPFGAEFEDLDNFGDPIFEVRDILSKRTIQIDALSPL